MADYLMIKEVNRSISASVDGGGGRDPWLKILEDAPSESAIRPCLKHFFGEPILEHDSLGWELARLLGKVLSRLGLWRLDRISDLLQLCFTEDRGIMCEIREDLRYVSERHAPFNIYLHTLLYSRDFSALAAYRVPHKLWLEGITVIGNNVTIFHGKLQITDEKGAEHPTNVVRQRPSEYSVPGIVEYFRNQDAIRKLQDVMPTDVSQRVTECFCRRIVDENLGIQERIKCGMLIDNGTENSILGKNAFSEIVYVIDATTDLEGVMSTDTEPTSFRSKLDGADNVQDGGVQPVKVDQSDGATGVVTAERAVVRDQGTTEEPLAVEEPSFCFAVVGDHSTNEELLAGNESLFFSVSSLFSQKNCLQSAKSWFAKYAQAPCLHSFLSPGSASPGSPPHGGGHALHHQSNGSASSSQPAVAAQVSGATSSGAAQGDRLPDPSGNGGADGRQPSDIEENNEVQAAQPDNLNEETRRNLLTVASACLATSGAVGIALPAIQYTKNVHLSGDVSLLLSLAAISSVVGFFLSLSGFILLLRNRNSGLARRVPAGLARGVPAGLVTRVLTGAGCAFTACGFLFFMGTLLPESLMLGITGFTCLIPITVLPFMF